MVLHLLSLSMSERRFCRDVRPVCMADDLPRTKIVIDVSVCTIRRDCMKRFHRADNFVFDEQKEQVALKRVAIEDPICSLLVKFPAMDKAPKSRSVRNIR